MAVHETNCQVKFSTWPTTGTTITNEGLAGSSYNGIADENHYHPFSGGVTAFVFNDAEDIITIPKGDIINNTTNITLEFIVTPVDAGMSQTLWDKGGQYTLFIGNGSLMLWRGGRDALMNYVAKWWTTAPNLEAGKWYFIQISWDGGFSTDPLIKINDEVQVLTPGTTGTPIAWDYDTIYDMTLGNLAVIYPYPFAGDITLFRFHNAPLTSNQLHDNYLADSWRMGNAIPQLTGICKFFARISDLARQHLTGRSTLVAQIPRMRIGEVPGLTGRTPEVTLTQTVTDNVTLTGVEPQEENIE